MLWKKRRELRDKKEYEAGFYDALHYTDMKSPFTGGKCTLHERWMTVNYRGEDITIRAKYYRCEDTGHEFTDARLDDDTMWAVFRAWCDKQGFESFKDICPWEPKTNTEKDEPED